MQVGPRKGRPASVPSAGAAWAFRNGGDREDVPGAVRSRPMPLWWRWGRCCRRTRCSSARPSPSMMPAKARSVAASACRIGAVGCARHTHAQPAPATCLRDHCTRPSGRFQRMQPTEASPSTLSRPGACIHHIPHTQTLMLCSPCRWQDTGESWRRLSRCRVCPVLQHCSCGPPTAANGDGCELYTQCAAVSCWCGLLGHA